MFSVRRYCNVVTFQITNNFGAPCDQHNSKNFMNNCNYSAAFDLLNFIYGGNLKASWFSVHFLYNHQMDILNISIVSSNRSK